jgi:tRNA (guanosine-2'-O-)-methyltransferase
MRPMTASAIHAVPAVPPHPFDELISEGRASRYRAALARRCGDVVVVLERCVHPHNAAAVLRTCDAFGIQDVHVVAAADRRFKPQVDIAAGSHLYLTMHAHASAADAFTELRHAGFQIAAGALTPDAAPLPEALDAELAARPLALVFGNERDGLTASALAAADCAFAVPMCGLTQSLNLSVSVAVTLYSCRAAEIDAGAPQVGLPVARQQALYDRWVRHYVARREAGARCRNGLAPREDGR